MRQVIIYPGEDGYWVAECPSLPGCASQGETREEAIASIREAIQVYITIGTQRGTDIVPRRDDPFAQVVVPHYEELDRGTLRAIIRPAGLSVDEFLKFLCRRSP